MFDFKEMSNEPTKLTKIRCIFVFACIFAICVNCMQDRKVWEIKIKLYDIIYKV